MVHPDCATRTESSAGPAAFTFGLGNLHDSSSVFFHERKSAIGAEVHAHTAAGTFLLNTGCKVRFEFHFSLVNRDTCRGCCTFRRCYRVRDIFGTLADTSKEDTGCGGSARVELRVCLKEPSIHGAGDTEEFPGPVCICFWLDCGGEYDKIYFHIDRA